MTQETENTPEDRSLAGHMLGGWLNFSDPIGPMVFLAGMGGAFLYITFGSFLIFIAKRVFGVETCPANAVFGADTTGCQSETWPVTLSWILLLLVFSGKIAPLLIRLFRTSLRP